MSGNDEALSAGVNMAHRDEQLAARARKSRGRLQTIRQQQKRIEALARNSSSLWHQRQDAERRAILAAYRCDRCWWCRFKAWMFWRERDAMLSARKRP